MTPVVFIDFIVAGTSSFTTGFNVAATTQTLDIDGKQNQPRYEVYIRAQIQETNQFWYQKVILNRDNRVPKFDS